MAIFNQRDDARQDVRPDTCSRDERPDICSRDERDSTTF